MKNKFISTFCSNLDAFYVNFLQDIDVYYDSHLEDVYDCGDWWRGTYNKSPLVALASFYASDTLRSMFSSRVNHDALIIHGTWHDQGEHSWWDYLHETFASCCQYTFRDDTWYLLNGRIEVHSEFGMSLLSLDRVSQTELNRAIMAVYHSVTMKDDDLHFDHYRYERALLSLKGQSILDDSWDSYPEILSGLTAAKYLPKDNDVSFIFGVIITLCELLRLITRSYIVHRTQSKSTEVANQYQDLLEIGDMILGGNW